MRTRLSGDMGGRDGLGVEKTVKEHELDLVQPRGVGVGEYGRDCHLGHWSSDTNGAHENSGTWCNLEVVDMLEGYGFGI